MNICTGFCGWWCEWQTTPRWCGKDCWQAWVLNSNRKFVRKWSLEWNLQNPHWVPNSFEAETPQREMGGMGKVGCNFGWIFHWIFFGGPTRELQEDMQKCFIAYVACFQHTDTGYMPDSSTDFHMIVRDLRHGLGPNFFGPTETQESSMDSESDLDCPRQFHQCPLAFKIFSSIVWVKRTVHRQCKGPRSKTYRYWTYGFCLKCCHSSVSSNHRNISKPYQSHYSSWLAHRIFENLVVGR